jgi:uncharacterized RmlC-like cupin family protein
MSSKVEIVGADAPKEFKRPKPFYELWQANEGIPVHKTFHVDDLKAVELSHWERFGCDAAFVNMADPYLATAIVLELKPGQSTKAVKHMFETLCYVVSGRGMTSVKQDGHQDQIVKWRDHSLFGPPLNTTYQHRNVETDRPARILMINNAPITMNLYRDDEFVFDNPFVFRSRYRGEQGYFNPAPEFLGGRIFRTNLIDDLRTFYLKEWKERGRGNKTVFLSMSHHSIAAHMSEFEVGTYKKAHRHGPGAHVVLLTGTGYSLIWKDGDEPQRVDWKEGAMFSPPDMYYHQHFNTGKEPARYLALKPKGNPEHPVHLGAPGPNSDPEFARQHQIESEDEAPWIYDMYAEELRKNGMKLRQARPEYRKH